MLSDEGQKRQICDEEDSCDSQHNRHNYQAKNRKKHETLVLNWAYEEEEEWLLLLDLMEEDDDEEVG